MNEFYDEAEKHYRDFMQKAEGNKKCSSQDLADVIYRIGKAQRRGGNYHKALESFEKALSKEKFVFKFSEQPRLFLFLK